jgi:hypothetical protein
MKQVALAVGDVVEFVADTRLSRADGSFLERGCTGEVVEVKPPRKGGTAYDMPDGERVVEKDRDGYAVVEWASWGRALVWAKDEGSRWLKVTR